MHPESHDFSLFKQLQRKRHIGNDIVCVVFLEAGDTNFSPACIKSHFLHTFIVVRSDGNNSSLLDLLGCPHSDRQTK